MYLNLPEIRSYSSYDKDLIQRKVIESIKSGFVQKAGIPAIQAKCAKCETESELQRKEDGEMTGRSPFEIASAGFSGTPTRLPHLETIQRSFGRDMSHVQAFIGGRAIAASQQLGATAYTAGKRIAFAKSPSLELAAHEAAHVT